MNIEHAYCQELGRIVNIYEAHREFFNQDTPRKRFKFLCSDPQCRENNTRVTGVNYDKRPEEAVTFRASHFRELDQHISTCEWIEMEEAKQIEIEAEDDEETKKSKRFLAAKNIDLISVFQPATADQEHIQVNTTEVEKLERVREIQDKSERLKEYCLYSRTLSKTNKLHKVVECYITLREANKLKHTTLEVNNTVTTYYKAFAHIKYYRDALNGRIFYGGAQVKKYRSGFAFYYYDNNEATWNHQGKKMSLFLSNKEIENYRHNSFIKGLLEDSSGNGYVTTYFFGSLQVSENKADYLNVTLDSLDHLHIVLHPKA